jgi:coenzyme F420-0:L-glutamate ligase/coenzyme F420-1:gamma-L-glutamate ligase
MFHQLALFAVPDFPLVEPGNELASMISDACLKAGIALNDGDVVVIAQKIVSKAEGQIRQFERCDPVCPIEGVGNSA